MNITTRNHRSISTKSGQPDNLNDSDKENCAPCLSSTQPCSNFKLPADHSKAPQHLHPRHPPAPKPKPAKRVLPPRPKPRGFEPWGPHADFLSPPPRRKIPKSSSRRTVADLASTPPRPSYAERVKGIFASPPSTGLAKMREDVDVKSASDGQDDLKAPVAAEDGKMMHLHFTRNDTQTLRNDGGDNNVNAPSTVRKSDDDESTSPLTSESELERQLSNFAFISPKKDTSSHPVGNLEEAKATFSASRAPSPTTQPPAQNPHHPIPRIRISPRSNPVEDVEEESSDAWTDDSQFLPGHAMRRRQRMERARINRERFFYRPDIPKKDTLSPNHVRIAVKMGLIDKDQMPREASSTERPQMGIGRSPKPSRFTGVSSRGVEVPQCKSARCSR